MTDVFDFDKLPDSVTQKAEKGTYKLTVVDAREVYAKSGSRMLQLSYVVNDNDKFKLNYDNCVLSLANGSPCTFGLHKMKNIIKATKVGIGQFSLSTLSALLKGKSFLADLEPNDKNYLELRDVESIRPLETDDVTDELGAEEVVIQTDTSNDMW